MTTQACRRRLIQAGAIVAAVGLLTACGTDSGFQSVVTTSTTTRPPTTTTSPPPPPPCTPGTQDKNDASASLRPAGPLPTPGAMPAGSFMRTIQDRGRLIAGGSPDTLYFGFIDPATGQYSGFDIDVLREIARAIFGEDGHLVVQTVPVASVVPALQQGTVDIVAHTLTQTCKRRLFIDFSTEYYQASQKVLVRSDSTARGIEDLSGKRVCATKASTSLDNITRLNRKVIPVGDAENADCLVDLQTGRVDAVSTDDTILAGMVAQDRYAKIVGNRLTNEPYGLAFRQQHPEFIRFVNGVLERMRGDGTLQAIYNRWLLPIAPVPVPFPVLYRD